MKNIVDNPKSCLVTMVLLIVICEVLLNTNIVIIQFLGICLLPFIVVLGILLMINSKEKNVE